MPQTLTLDALLETERQHERRYVPDQSETPLNPVVEEAYQTLLTTCRAAIATLNEASDMLSLKANRLSRQARPDKEILEAVVAIGSARLTFTRAESAANAIRTNAIRRHDGMAD